MTKTVKDERYLCVSAYVRALEAQLLTGGDLQRMIDADDVREAIRLLTDHGYPEMAPHMVSLEDTLRHHREALMASLSDFLPEGGLLDLFRIRYDYHNAKVALKALWTDVDATRLLMGGGRLEPLWLYQTLRTGEDQTLPPIMEQAVQEARERVGATLDPQKGDLLLDKAAFAEQSALAEAVGSPFLLDYVALLIDTANLLAAVRILRMGKDAILLEESLLPGGTVSQDRLLESARAGTIADLYTASLLEEAAGLGQQALSGGSLTAFEKACDDAQNAFLQRAMLIPFGPEPVLAFLAAREQEMRNVRIIISGKLAKLPASTIRERMREAYV